MIVASDAPPTGDAKPPASPLPPVPAASARLFLALWPAADERRQLVRHAQDWSWRQGSALVQANDLHLTLHFIGALDRQRIAEVSAGLQVPMAPFELSLTRAELWPRGLAVLRVGKPAAALIQLHDRLGQAMRALELPPEPRRFRPHVTLARRAAESTLPTTPPQHIWRVSSYVLVESLAHAGGAYSIVRRYA
ncbi:RNA 2',3'-cyclic phosphodiesterase [Candidatus Accumulibacter sp. ACC003]|uniref:RNA 2',3'-cyclic phosphodiesterase n=1 Tax=Candidatus Accumulibacter sp. ACC003 TaxID=2823334 RepID=UPI0025C30A31|nr:RNA 2',3'-cyclic phosphodiesterase [Candidatus Accumulibacter sp. ACC003]